MKTQTKKQNFAVCVQLVLKSLHGSTITDTKNAPEKYQLNFSRKSEPQ